MYLDKKKRLKIIKIINVILIVYIFTLSIGYSLFSETLNVSGKATTIGDVKDWFRWESNTVISGLTDKGIAAIKANGGELVIPEGVTEIASSIPNTTDTTKPYLSNGFSFYAIGGIPSGGVTEEQRSEFDIITSVSFPSTLLKIGDFSFFQCQKLTSIVLPENLKEVGLNSFAITGLIGKLIIPNSVTSIGNAAFLSTKIGSLVIGTSVETISNGAFFNCTELSGELYIPDGVQNVGDMAFGISDQSLNKLTNISVNSNTTYNNLNDSVLSSFYNRVVTVRNDATELKKWFDWEGETTIVGINNYGNEQLKLNGGVLYIPLGTKEIGSGAFQGNRYIKRVIFPNTLETVQNAAFISCTELTGILNIPDSVTYVGIQAFYKTKITSIKIGAGLERIAYRSFEDMNELTGKLEIPKTVKTIEAGAFALSNPENNKITEISVSGFTEVMEDSFHGRIEPTLKKFSSRDWFTWEGETIVTGLSTTGETGLNENDGYLDFPEGVTEIKQSAFVGKDIIKRVLFPSSLITIGASAFNDCYNLGDTLEIPDNVTSIGNSAFCRSSIVNISFGTGVKTIGGFAFFQIDTLEGELYIPDNVENIQGWAFTANYGKNKITNISISSKTTFDSNSFTNRVTPTIRN